MIPPIASRFVAGESVPEVLDHVRSVNDRELRAIVNLLGESHTTRAAVAADADTYRTLIEDIAGSNLEACISVKPTQLGLSIGADVFRDTLGDLVSVAAAHDIFVWIDMERHETVDATLDAYESLVRDHDGGLGVCVQANLRRTRADVERLAPLPGKVRFVKGAYDEPASIAYQETAVVDQQYKDLLTYAFDAFDDGIAVGSHDPAMIEHAISLHETHGTPFEIQMLMGIREEAQTDLAQEYDVWQYVPYGSGWLPYFWRRVLERKQNLEFALRAVLGR
jgi:proline dehydrogenase